MFCWSLGRMLLYGTGLVSFGFFFGDHVIRYVGFQETVCHSPVQPYCPYATCMEIIYVHSKLWQSASAWPNITASLLPFCGYCFYHTPAWIQTRSSVWEWGQLSQTCLTSFEFLNFGPNWQPLRHIIIIRGRSVRNPVRAMVECLMIMTVYWAKDLQP